MDIVDQLRDAFIKAACAKTGAAIPSDGWLSDVSPDVLDVGIAAVLSALAAMGSDVLPSESRLHTEFSRAVSDYLVTDRDDEAALSTGIGIRAVHALCAASVNPVVNSLRAEIALLRTANSTLIQERDAARRQASLAESLIDHPLD